MNTAATQFRGTVTASSTTLDKGAIQIAEQVAGLTRISGDLKSVYSPSPATVQRLEVLEQTVADQSKWPATLEDAEKLRAELKALNDSVPPVVQDAMLPRLIPLRWSVQALLMIRANSPLTYANADEAGEIYESLLETQPESAPKRLAELVAAESTKAAEKVSAIRRTSAIEAAAKSLREAKDTDAVSAAWNTLDALDNKDATITELQKKLRTKLLTLEVGQRCAEFRRQLEQIKSLADTSLKQIGMGKIYDLSTTYRLSLLSDTTGNAVPVGELDHLIADVATLIKDDVAKQQREYAQKTRDYQSWALKRINVFNASYAATEKAVKDQWFNKWGDEHYKSVRDTMVNQLIEISANHLDVPVAQLYQKAFQKGWERLDGRDDQLHVAQKSATTVKKIPEDM